MNDVTLGQIIEGDAKRDAIHIAVAPVVAAIKMYPGDHVGLYPDGTASTDEEAGPRIGIVDPFLDEEVLAGEKFWLCLYQKSVTGMRHHWQHPTFDHREAKAQQDRSKAESEAWLRAWIKTADCPDYDTVIAAATGEPVKIIDDTYGKNGYINDGEYITFLGRDAHGRIPPEFWDHVENVTGKKIPEENKAHAFSCSC